MIKESHKGKYILLTSALFVAFARPGYAVELTTTTDSYKQFKDTIQETKANVKETVKSTKNLRAKQIKASVKSINNSNSSLIIVGTDNVDYTVETSSDTKFIRKYGSKSQLSEVSVGDTISVYGNRESEGSTTINATIIRNASIEKRNIAIWSKVTAINGSTLTLETCKYGTQTAKIDPSTIIKNADNTNGSISDISVGSFVIVKGLWNRTSNTLDATGTQNGKAFIRKNIGCFNSQ